MRLKKGKHPWGECWQGRGIRKLLGCWPCSFLWSGCWNCLVTNPISILFFSPVGALTSLLRLGWHVTSWKSHFLAYFGTRGGNMTHFWPMRCKWKLMGLPGNLQVDRLCGPCPWPLQSALRVWCPQPWPSQMYIHVLLCKIPPHVTCFVVWFTPSTNNYWTLTVSWACADQGCYRFRCPRARPVIGDVGLGWRARADKLEDLDPG